MRSRARQLRPGIGYRQSGVDDVAIEDRRMYLGDGTVLRYDVLVVATGAALLPGETDGLAEALTRGRVCNFNEPSGAAALRDALARFHGGRIAINVVDMPIKCPVAPVEFSFLADWYFCQRGIRDRVELTFVTPLDGAFTRAVCNRELSGLLTGKRIELVTEFNTGQVDADLERRPVARQVLGRSHLAFWGEAATGWVPSVLRSRVAPLAAPVVPAIKARRRLVAAGVRVLSGLWVNYRGSPLSMAGTPCARGGPRAGDRLPDQTATVDGRSVRLHELLEQPGVHGLLDRDAASSGIGPVRCPLVSVHRLSSSPGRGLTVVRPDGYIGLRTDIADGPALGTWLKLVVPC